MTKIQPFLTIIYILIVLTACQHDQSTSDRNSSESPPNIVFILSDDQAWTDYSFMGHPHIETPHIDKLAKESLTSPWYLLLQAPNSCRASF